MSKSSRKQRVESIGRQILDAFAEGRLPKALATFFIQRDPDSTVPSAKWSWSNRLLAALAGYHEAAGFRQWERLGRRVQRGEKAFHILGPCTVRAREDDAERGIEAGDLIVVGFTPIAVFGYEQTEGEPLPYREREVAFLDALPLIEVARAWGLTVATFAGEGAPHLGYYRRGQAIALGVENLTSWAHELLHAADDRLGTISARPGDLDNEVVAELGGAILLEALGHSEHSDLGGAYAYIQGYCRKHQADLLATCHALIERTCAAVEYLLDEAKRLACAPDSGA